MARAERQINVISWGKFLDRVELSIKAPTVAMLRITVKNLQSQTVLLEAVSPDCSVRDLRALAQQRTGWQVGKVILQGKVLDDEKTLAASAVGDASVLICTGATAKRPRPAMTAVTTAAVAPAAAAPAPAASVRAVLLLHPELVALLGLPAALLDGGRRDELPHDELQAVLTAACGMLLASTAAHPAVAKVMAVLGAAPWNVAAVSSVMTLQDPELPAVPGHALMAGLRWAEATEHHRAEFLTAVCGPSLLPPARPRLLQRMLLGDPSIANGASVCALSLARTFIDGHVNDVLTAIETDEFSGPRYLSQCNASVPGVLPLLRFLLLGYQHSPTLYVATRGGLTAAAGHAGPAATLAPELLSHLCRLHGNPSAAAQAAQPAAQAAAERAAAHAALMNESWAASIRSGVKLVRSSGDKDDAAEIRPAGLHNLGNTCFANSWLQALYLTQPFRVALLTAPLSTGATRPAVALALQRLAAGLLLSPRRALDATKFLKALPKWDCIEGWRSRTQQQDSAEFGNLLLERVEYEVKDIPGAAHLVSDTFGGVLASTVRCGCCGACSASRETMELFTLSVDLPQQAAAADTATGKAERKVAPPVATCQLLAEHFVAEKLEGGDGKPIYQCDECAAIVPATKGLEVVTAPQYMLVAFKRFSFDGSATKLTHRVGLSLWVWLPDTPVLNGPTAVAAQDGGVGINLAAASDDTIPEGQAPVEHMPPETRMYVLYAVIVHSGTSANSGHYYCYGRSTDRTAVEQTHSPDSPVATLAATLWEHGQRLARMKADDRNGAAGRALAADAAEKLRQGIAAAGGLPTDAAAASPVQALVIRLAAETDRLETAAGGDGDAIGDMLHATGNLLAQYSEATHGSTTTTGWWLYNDATVSPVSGGFAAVENLGAGNAHETPYLLLYKRCGGGDGGDGGAGADIAPDDQLLGVDQVPPTVRYAAYADELALLRKGADGFDVKSRVAMDSKWMPPPSGAGGPPPRMSHRFGPAGGSAMGGGMGHIPAWGM